MIKKLFSFTFLIFFTASVNAEEIIMKYKFKIIKVSGNEAIGKIIWKKAPYVTPQKGDMIEFEE